VSGNFKPLLQDLISGAIPAQKYHKNLGLIYSFYGDTDI